MSKSTWSKSRLSVHVSSRPLEASGQTTRFHTPFQHSRPISAVKKSQQRSCDACDGERFASFTMCATINLAMSALIFTGDLQEVLPGTLAVRGEPGKQCAVCESCKGFSCKVLR